MPIFIIIILAAIFGLSLFGAALYHGTDGSGFLGWLKFAFFAGPFFVGSITWCSLAYLDRVSDPNSESIHVVDKAEQKGVSVQYLVARYGKSVSFVNLNKKFNGVIEKDDFVRRYCLEEWKYGIKFFTVHSDYEYELIGPKHERYAEAKKIIDNE